MKVCSFCGIEKEENEFHWNNYKGTRKLRPDCKVCRLQKSAEAYQKKYHGEVPLVKPRYHYDSNKAKVYYRQNKEEIDERNKRYRKSVEGRAQAMWQGAKERARKRRFECTISRFDIEEIIRNGTCQRTGIAFDLSYPTNGERKNRYTPSIDKIDQRLGYTKENVQIVVWCYNSGKGEMTDDQFIAFCKTVAEFNK